MAWECIVKDRPIEDVKKDHRMARSVEQYSISEQAVYFQGYYLPLSLIRSIRVQPSVYRPKHSCGRGLPVFKIRLDYEGEKPLLLMLEKESSAQKIVSQIRASNPDAVLEEYTDPETGEKPDHISSVFR